MPVGAAWRTGRQPSLSTVVPFTLDHVVEQTGESVKDSLAARKPRASLTDSPACSKASNTRAKGKSEGVMI